jgi:hypothetical protein
MILILEKIKFIVNLFHGFARYPLKSMNYVKNYIKKGINAKSRLSNVKVKK